MPVKLCRWTVSTSTCVMPVPLPFCSGTLAPFGMTDEFSWRMRSVTVRSALMFGVMSRDVPMFWRVVIGVAWATTPVPRPLAMAWAGVKPIVTGTCWPEKIWLTSLLAVINSGVARAVTRLRSSSSCSRARKLALTTWNTRSWGVPGGPAVACGEIGRNRFTGLGNTSLMGGRMSPVVNPA